MSSSFANFCPDKAQDLFQSWGIFLFLHSTCFVALEAFKIMNFLHTKKTTNIAVPVFFTANI